ncbi:MAG TPA: TRAP transporter substrate-binding protein [Bacilli bacterium]|nr:TRAP transporter substrate-binding protein [Bacilli bacterium]
MKKLISIMSFLIVGIATAFYIGFGFNTTEKPKAVDDELRGLNKKYLLYFSHVVAENTPKGIAASMFAQKVREKTNGWVEVQVFPNGMLYNAQEEFEALKRNEVQIIAPALSEITVHDPKWVVMDLPFAFDDVQMVKQAFEGNIGKLLFDSIENHGYKGIAFWDNSFKQFTNNVRPVKRPSDISGLSVRIMPSKVLAETYLLLGAKSHSYSFNEVYELLSEGQIDGTENTLSNIYSKGFYKKQKYMTISNHNYLGYAVLMNNHFWNTLPIEHQNSMMEAMNEVTEWLRVYAEEHNNEVLEKIEKSGVIEVYKLTDEERMEWKNALRPIYEQYKHVIGKNLMDEIMLLQDRKL